MPDTILPSYAVPRPISMGLLHDVTILVTMGHGDAKVQNCNAAGTIRSSSASNSASASDSQSAVSTAGQSTSWTNTWWTPSPTPEAAQSTSTTESSTSSRRRKSKTSTSTSVWGWNSQPDPSATSSSATSSSATSSSAVTTASTSIPATGTTATLASPHYVIYSDAWLTSMPSLSDVAGYNRFLLAFWLSDRGAADNALFWSSLTTTERAAVKAEYNAAGVAVMVSAFGATDNPTTMGVDPTACAQSLAAFVKAYDLDGVDIDYEDANAFNTGVAEAWLITFQTVLRQQLPMPYIISHAPQAPWFTSTGQYTGGGYTKVHAAVGNGIDFYNIQFYNQGDIYNDCVSLISTSGGYFPSTSVFEIHSYSSVPLSKIVIGKPLDAAAASNGYMDSATLAQCVKQAKAKGWDGGVMYWEFQKSLATLSMLAVVG
ncbi:hypothetical protein QFC19_004102 [Naganishia cerealis]|uniref:Uncharacterized protein n=1 Tax=Naganishia cerealis TaxID=610337 RepID=A0ACC2VYH2_9TREE|nr:hypothetical protein QFC19_004102 [Naganishia cerealis]